jgi:two-component system sensor histidine kinase RpfC
VSAAQSGNAAERGAGALRRTGVHRWLGSALVERLRHRPDREHEMTINRLVISVLIMGYLLVASAAGQAKVGEAMSTAIVFFACSVALTVDILLRPGISVTRRVLAICADTGMLSYGIYVGEESTSLLYPIYLWVIFGNGFRFGLKYLFLATAISVTGFAIVVTTADYWRAHLHLAGGLLGGLIVLPLYAASLIRKLSAARQQAEEASRAKSRFLTSVSHELRTPLNAIIGLSELMRGTPLDSEQQEMTRTIGTAGRSLLALINQILDLGRIEERRIQTTNAAFDLYGLLADVRAILSVQAHAKSVRFAVHATLRTPRFVKTDRRHLQEILVNLGGNAVKFTERGFVVIGVDVEDRGGELHLRCEISDSGIGIAPEAKSRIFESFTQADETIIDRFGGTGLGLAIVKQLVEFHGGTIGVDSTPHVGSTFWFEWGIERAEAPAASVPPRLGAVVLLSSDAALRDLIEAAGAELHPASTTDAAAAAVLALRQQGTRKPVVVIDAGPSLRNAEAIALQMVDGDVADGPSLVVVTDEEMAGMLPVALRSLFMTVLARPLDAERVAAALQLSAGPDEASPAEKPSVARRKRTVLVAEDNRTNQMVIAKILTRAGHEVQLVDNGEGALDALNARAFDIVLMDVNMPVMNGIEATKLYRFASLGMPRIPIVALTADATAEAAARCEEAGMDACVTKPIEPSRLVEIIDQLVADDTPGTEAAPPPEGVTHIAEHPKFRPGAAQSVALQVLQDLDAIGGKEFVAELAGQFLADAGAIIAELDAAAADGDVTAFRERAHALRSSAANIGAHGIYDLCVAWRQINAGDLSGQGRAHVRKLTEELERVRLALDEHLGKAAPQPAPVTEIAAARTA